MGGTPYTRACLADKDVPFSPISPFSNGVAKPENGPTLDSSNESRRRPGGKPVENGEKRSKNGGTRVFGFFAAARQALGRVSGVALTARSSRTSGGNAGNAAKSLDDT